MRCERRERAEDEEEVVPSITTNSIRRAELQSALVDDSCTLRTHSVPLLRLQLHPERLLVVPVHESAAQVLRCLQSQTSENSAGLVRRQKLALGVELDEAVVVGGGHGRFACSATEQSSCQPLGEIV